MRALFKIISLEKKIRTEKKKCIALSVPYSSSKEEGQSVNHLAEEYITEKNLKADLFVILVNYAESEPKIASEFWYN
jgi:hypothetical protein